MAYIIDSYNQYSNFDRQHSRYQFEINGNWYAIKEVEMEWGLPKLDYRVDQDIDGKHYFIYDTYEDAMKFVFHMKSIN